MYSYKNIYVLLVRAHKRRPNHHLHQYEQKEHKGSKRAKEEVRGEEGQRGIEGETYLSLLYQSAVLHQTQISAI